MIVYNKISDWYDEHRSRDLFEKAWLDKAINLLANNSQILDLGCGTGAPIISYFLERNFNVTGVDSSTKLISLAKSRYCKAEFIIADMRHLNLHRKFDMILAWNSFFHLSPDDQRAMFEIFASHLKIGGVLMFTSGPEYGEVWIDNGGEELYHASLSPDEYKALLKQYGFTLVKYKLSDPECHSTTVWLAKLQPKIEKVIIEEIK